MLKICIRFVANSASMSKQYMKLLHLKFYGKIPDNSMISCRFWYDVGYDTLETIPLSSIYMDILADVGCNWVLYSTELADDTCL